MAKKAEGARLDEIRQAMARLHTDNEKLDLLIQIAGDTQKTDPKLAIQVLEDAKQIVNRRATSYEHFEQQLRVRSASQASIRRAVLKCWIRALVSSTNCSQRRQC